MKVVQFSNAVVFGAHMLMGIMILYVVFMHAHTVCLDNKQCLYRNVIETP